MHFFWQWYLQSPLIQQRKQFTVYIYTSLQISCHIMNRTLQTLRLKAGLKSSRNVYIMYIHVQTTLDRNSTLSVAK